MKRIAILLCLLSALAVHAEDTDVLKNPSNFRAGVAATDISPTDFPRIIAGGFLEGKGEKLTDRLHARCFVLDDGKTKIAFAIVDTCMMTQQLPLCVV